MSGSESLLNNDLIFYLLVGAFGLAIFLAAWGLLRRGRPRAEDETLARRDREKDERAMESLLSKGEESRPFREQIVEPRIAPTLPAGMDETPRPSVPTDTVEIFKGISTTETEPDRAGAEPVQPPPVATIPLPLPERKPEPPREKEAEPAPKTLTDGLSKTKKGFIDRINGLVFGRKQIEESVLEELEQILYEADIGPTATRLFQAVQERARRGELKDPSRIKDLLKEEILAILKSAERPAAPIQAVPHVIMIVGVNGVGKTTTIGKLARRYIEQGKKVMLSAADTFRAAAVEQLVIWGDRAGAEVITAAEGANPSGVVYTSVQAAQTRGADVLIVDTAGRLHTKYNLMEELRKIRSVAEKALGRAPDETWLVLDANTGQNAVNQAQKFHEAIHLTGLVLTKLDGTAKGGVVIGITDQLRLPIRFIGIGEAVADLRPFEPVEFVDALFR